MSESINSSPMSLDPSPTVRELERRYSLEENSDYTNNYKSVGELRSITELPNKYWHIFSSYPSFNAFQSRVMTDVIYSDKPVVVSAPTGSGKTVVFELAIVKLLNKIDELKYSGNFIVVYLAPIKALCSERFRDWSFKFSPIGLKCQEVTGDTDTSDLLQVLQYNIVLTTPEKWDSLTRKWRGNQKIIQLVKLFLIDEVHLLNDERRGPILEAVVSRMKTVQAACQHSNINDDLPIPIRFIAVSATIPNIEDVASWIGDFSNPAVSFKLGEEFRPVKLKKIVLGYNCPQNCTQFRFEMMLSYRLKDILLKYAEGKPAMIFCSTRKGVFQTSQVVSQQLTFNFSAEQEERLSLCITKMKDNKIKNYILAGVGCHHAGMDIEDRRITEDLFRSGFLPVLITTTTLAMGVNLPAHLVIIKSTQQYLGGTYQDYSESQLLQMIGRAGRPQFDTSSTAVIMTKNSKREQYDKLVEGKSMLESSLHRHLVEHLNSEVVLSTITEKAVAINWIRSTFLYVRAMRNPRYYGFQDDLTKLGIENKLQDMCLRELNALASINLLDMDILDVRPTETGRLMAQYYMAFETMKIFTKITGTENLSEMLAVVSSCQEFSDCQLRMSDKKTLNALNKSQNGIRFPLKGLFKTREMKINCLIQASFGCLTIQDSSLHQEAIRIIHLGGRVTKCLAKYLSLQNHYKSILNTTLLAKCFHCCLWEKSDHVSRQLDRIGPVLSALLVASGKTSFQAIAKSNPRDLERIMNRPPPMGNKVQEAAKHLPQYSIELNVTTTTAYQVVEIRVALINIEEIKYSSTAGPNHWLTLLAGDSDNKLWLCKRFKDEFLINGIRSWSLKIPDLSSPEEIYTNLISDQWVGLDIKSSIKLKNNIIPQHVKEVLKKHVQTKVLNSEEQLTQTKKSTETIRKMKQKPLSVTHQLQNITNEILQDLGTKRIRSNVISTSSRVDLSKFLYTPLKKKKLPPTWNEFMEAKSDQSICTSNSSLPVSTRASRPQELATSQLQTFNNENLPPLSVGSSVIMTNNMGFMLDNTVQNGISKSESTHEMLSTSKSTLQQAQSTDYISKLSVISELNKNVKSLDTAEFTDTDFSNLKRRSDYAHTDCKKSSICNYIIRTHNIQSQKLDDKCKNIGKKGPYFNAISCHNNNTSFKNSFEDITSDNKINFKVQQCYPIFSKNLEYSKEKDSECSWCEFVPKNTFLTDHQNSNENEIKQTSSAKIITQFKDTEADCSFKGDCFKINVRHHHSNMAQNCHESTSIRDYAYGEQGNVRNEKDMKFSLQKFDIQDVHGSYPVKQVSLKLNFDLGIEQFLTKFCEDNITDDIQLIENGKRYKDISDTNLMKSNNHKYKIRNKRKYNEDKNDPVTSLLYNIPSQCKKLYYKSEEQTVPYKVMHQSINIDECTKNTQLPDFTSVTSDDKTVAQGYPIMLRELKSLDVDTEYRGKESFTNNMSPISQQEIQHTTENGFFNTNIIRDYDDSFSDRKNHQTSEYQYLSLSNHDVLLELSNYANKTKNNNVTLNFSQEMQFRSHTASVCYDDQTLLSCFTSSHLGEQQHKTTAALSDGSYYNNHHPSLHGTEIYSQEMFTEDSTDDEDCVVTLSISPLVLSNVSSPISSLTSACSNMMY